MNVSTQFKGNDKVLLGFILAVLTFWLFANSMMNISPQMIEQLGVDSNSMNMAVSLAALFSGIFVVVIGGLADSIGRVKILRIGIYLSILGSLIIAFTPSGTFSQPMLLLGRALQGFSAACIMPTSLGLVKLLWEGAERQRAVSFWSIGTFGGSGLSSLFGGIIASNMGWRWIFIFSALVAIIALLLIKDLPESKKENAGKYKPDFGGIILFLIAMIGLELFITKGNQFGWTSITTILLLIIALIFFFFFYKYERRSSIAFFDFSLFKNRIFSSAVTCNFLLNATSGILIVTLTLMQRGAFFTSQQAGFLTLGYAIAVIVFIRIGEKLLQHYGARKPMMWGSLIVVFAIILLMQTHTMTTIYIIIASVGFTMFGLGLAFFATPATDAALSNLPAEQSGAGAGIFKMASSLGAGLGVAISSGIFTTIVTSGNVIDLISSIFIGRQDNIVIRQAAMIALGVCLLFAIVSFIVAYKMKIANKELVQ